MMSAAVLNPHHAGHERSEDIPRQLRSWSIVVRYRTQHHAEIDAGVTVNRYPFHWSLHFGWRRGQWTHRSCGVKILRAFLLPKESRRDVFCSLSPLSPSSPRGRAGAARLRVGALDVLVVAGKVLRALEHEEQRGHRNEDLQDGRRPI